MRSSPVFLARIDLLIPQLGWAIISAADGTPSMKRSFMAKLPANDSTTGAIMQPNLVEGTAVLCAQDRNSVDLAYIIGPTSYAATEPDEQLEASALYAVDNRDDEAAVNGGEAFRKALEEKLYGRSLKFQDYDHGADIDAAPGDVDCIDQQGNAGVHVGRYTAQLRGSPICYVDASNITNKIRLVAPCIEQHSPLSVSISDKELAVHNIAINDSEAFGLQNNDPITITKTGLSLLYPDAIPLYRIQQTEGPAVDGKELVVVDYPEPGPHYCTTEPAILAKKRVSFTGELTEASAAAISSVKSPWLQAIHQVNYDPARSTSEQQDILQPYKYTASDEKDETPKPDSLKDAIDDAAINKIVDRMLSGDYLETLKQKMAEHGLKVSTADAQLANFMSGQTTGPSDKAAYDPPTSINVTDPVTGKTTTYFASTSFISQEADGSILICDGYGSEIRMSRGNIYISPALDLFLRPGRDLSAMVPRHQSYNAQQTTTINSSTSIYIRAINDLKLVGATEGNGMVTLECQAKEAAPTSGLLLKSMCGSTMIGNDIYIGRNVGDGVTEGRVSTPQRNGTIIIDACETGTMTLRSKENVVDASSVCLVASANNTASALRISPAMIGIYAHGVEIPANVQIQGKRSQEDVTVVRDGQKHILKLDTYTGDPQLVVGGALIVGGQFSCNDAGRFCGQLIANGVGSTSQYCGVVDTSYDDPFEKIILKKLDPHNDMGSTTATLMIGASRYIYQDAYISTNGFAFPANYDVVADLRVPGMMWQTNEATISNNKVWTELPVIGVNNKETMCYPGIAVWTGGEVSMPGYKTVSLLDGYLTNVK